MAPTAVAALLGAEQVKYRSRSEPPCVRIMSSVDENVPKSPFVTSLDVEDVDASSRCPRQGVGVDYSVENRIRR